MVALARLHADRGDSGPARTYFEKALALQTARPEREQTLRTLVHLALDEKDWDGAGKFHRELVKLDPTNLFVRGELGREALVAGASTRAR